MVAALEDGIGQPGSAAVARFHGNGAGVCTDWNGLWAAGALASRAGRRVAAVLLVSAGRRGRAYGAGDLGRPLACRAENARGDDLDDRRGRIACRRLRGASPFCRSAIWRATDRRRSLARSLPMGRGPATAAVVAPSAAGRQAAGIRRLARRLPLGRRSQAHSARRPCSSFPGSHRHSSGMPRGAKSSIGKRCPRTRPASSNGGDELKRFTAPAIARRKKSTTIRSPTPASPGFAPLPKSTTPIIL